MITLRTEPLVLCLAARCRVAHVVVRDVPTNGFDGGDIEALLARRQAKR